MGLQRLIIPDRRVGLLSAEGEGREAPASSWCWEKEACKGEGKRQATYSPPPLGRPDATLFPVALFTLMVSGNGAMGRDP